jgi:hypothetical protein
MLTGPLIGYMAENWALRVALSAQGFSSIFMFALVMMPLVMMPLVMMPLVKAVIVLQMKEALACIKTVHAFAHP